MGQYLIPNATSTAEAAAFIASPTHGSQWSMVEGGVLFTDETKTDAQCQALYSGFTPSGVTDGAFQWPMPDSVRLHTQHLRDYLNATSPTNAETVHVVKDMIRALFMLNSRLEKE